MLSDNSLHSTTMDYESRYYSYFHVVKQNNITTTYCIWSYPQFPPSSLAYNGFSYAGEDDKIVCVYCSKLIKNIKKNGWKVVEKHRKECKVVN